VKWVYLAGGGLLLLIAIVALIGAMLPQGHRATRQARYHKKPEAIYLAVAGPVDWRSDVKASGELPDRDGRKITYELVEDKLPSRRVTRIADKNLPFGGTWTMEISPTSEGSVVRITEDGEIHNAMFRFLARFVFGYTASIEGYLRDLGRHFGETAAIEP
jgi:hypothetical protein